MYTDNYYKLDNPAWYSLTETHRHFASGDDTVKRYPVHIAPFVACRPGKQAISTELDQWITPGESFFLIGDTPGMPVRLPGYVMESRLDCLQMICTEKILSTGTDTIEELGEQHDKEMLTLVNLVQPGYYNPGTRQMGLWNPGQWSVDGNGG